MGPAGRPSRRPGDRHASHPACRAAPTTLRPGRRPTRLHPASDRLGAGPPRRSSRRLLTMRADSDTWAIVRERSELSGGRTPAVGDSRELALHVAQSPNRVLVGEAGHDRPVSGGAVAVAAERELRSDERARKVRRGEHHALAKLGGDASAFSMQALHIVEAHDLRELISGAWRAVPLEQPLCEEITLLL